MTMEPITRRESKDLRRLASIAQVPPLLAKLPDALEYYRDDARLAHADARFPVRIDSHDQRRRRPGRALRS